MKYAIGRRTPNSGFSVSGVGRKVEGLESWLSGVKCSGLRFNVVDRRGEGNSDERKGLSYMGCRSYCLK